MGPVWQGRLKEAPTERVLRYCSGRDVRSLPMADTVLIPYDIWNNEAHGLMLHQCSVMSRREIGSVLQALRGLAERHDRGEFILDPDREDVHMNVESVLIRECGEETGMKIHTGRSRNDQVACDVRMYLRDRGLVMAEHASDLGCALLDWAADHLQTVMPGFSHTRHAAVTTFAHLLASHAQAIERDVQRLRFGYGIINRCPLGAAAGFGTSWPLDRELTAELLGFDSVQDNSLDCIGSLWEMEGQLAQALCFLMNHLSILCGDLIFLSTPESDMIDLPDRFVQGSSIMPQKRNPDVLEVTRAKASLAQGAFTSLMGLGKAGLSGYHRDLQYGKTLIMDLVGECEEAPAVLAEVLPHLQVNAENMRSLSRRGFLNAVDFAEALAREFSLPFRRAYHLVADAVIASEDGGELDLTAVNGALRGAGIRRALGRRRFEALMDPLSNVSARRPAGGPAPDRVEETICRLRRLFDEHLGWVRRRKMDLEAARGKIRKRAAELLP